MRLLSGFHVYDTADCEICIARVHYRDMDRLVLVYDDGKRFISLKPADELKLFTNICNYNRLVTPDRDVNFINQMNNIIDENALELDEITVNRSWQELWK